MIKIKNKKKFKENGILSQRKMKYKIYLKLHMDLTLIIGNMLEEIELKTDYWKKV